jgi:glyoxylase-like metal-dependent hydrolase (beta-lactamase superfamily II)
VPPASHTNCFWIGGDGASRVIIDPSPASREELARLFATLDSFGVDQVFLTHHHPDHREYADEVARRYNIPIGMSADTAARIRKRNAGFFDGVQTRIYADGDTLTHWQGEAVKLVAVPGHDEGQLAPMPESRAWCIVSDLYQGTGTVVVGGPEGNMAKYFDSLRKIIALDPAVIIPSHGLAQGTTHQLKKTLEHRILREQQIKTLYEAGRSQQEMFAEIYQGVDPRLAPLALINIQSHLAKLRDEGQIR